MPVAPCGTLRTPYYDALAAAIASPSRSVRSPRTPRSPGRAATVRWPPRGGSMTVRPESRWWIVLLLLGGMVFGLSALALNRADVVWAAGQPRCPHCRSRVEAFSTRCATCREEYDWTASADEDSPISPYSLSPMEERHLRARIKALGDDVAVQRVADALQLPRASVAEYLKQVGSGRCGWCGGTGREPSAGPDTKEKDAV